MYVNEKVVIDYRISPERTNVDTGNHEYDIIISGAGFEQIYIREMLPGALVDEAQLRLNQLALQIIITFLLSTRGDDHPLARLNNLTSANFSFVINQTNV
jgi:hypothetical protein